MKSSPLVIATRHASCLIGTLMLNSTIGCSVASVDPSGALDVLDDIHHRLAAHEQQQADLVADLTSTIADIAEERLRLRLLLDLDELTTPDGAADVTAIQRLLQEGSANAVVNEIRLGRLTPSEAAQLVGDVTVARRLSPGFRAAAEEHIVARFSSWQRLVSTRQSLVGQLDEQRTGMARLLDEAAQLIDAIRGAAEERRNRPIRIATVATQATQLIDDRQLRDSSRSLIELLLAAAEPSADTVARNQDR